MYWATKMTLKRCEDWSFLWIEKDSSEFVALIFLSKYWDSSLGVLNAKEVNSKYYRIIISLDYSDAFQ
jgi:hypothetical protein